TDIDPDRVDQIIMQPVVSGGCGFDAQHVGTGTDRLESLLREYRLQEDVSGERAELVYEEICRLTFTDGFHALLWDETVLRLLQDLFLRKPPNRHLFGGIVEAIFDRVRLVSRVNDLFFAFIDRNAGVQRVTELVSALFNPP